MLALRATRTSQAVVRLCVRPQEVSRSVRHASTLDWNKVQSLQLDEKVVAFTKVSSVYAQASVAYQLLTMVSRVPDALATSFNLQSYCPTCIDLLERLDDANVAVKNVELDKWGTYTRWPHQPLLWIALLYTSLVTGAHSHMY